MNGSEAEALRRAEDGSSRPRRPGPLDEIDSFIITVDRDYRITYGNLPFRRAVRRRFGWRIRRSDCFLEAPLPPGLIARWKGFADRCFAGESFNEESEIESPMAEGKLEILAQPMRGPDGGIKGCVVLATPHAALRATRRALRETEERYRTVYETAPLAFILWDLECRVTHWNREAERVFGWSREEVLGRSFYDFLVPEGDRPQVEEVVSALRRGEIPSHSINRNTTRGGGTILCEWNNSLLRDASGDLVGAVSVGCDITGRARGEASLRSIFRAAPVGIGVVASRVITEVNDTLCRITGYEPAEMVGQSARMLYPTQEEFEYVGREKYRQIRESGSGCVETHWRRKDGRLIDVLLSSCPIEPEDLSVGVTFTALDITERKQEESWRSLALRTLEILNREKSKRAGIRDLLALLREGTGFQALGIRLRDGDDFPYYETLGFPADFIEAESFLRRAGAPAPVGPCPGPLSSLEGMCGRVLSGGYDPALSFFTPGGSFWTNQASALPESELEKVACQGVRARCRTSGYESIALIPLRSGREIVGLLQLNDSRPHRFTREMITFLEGLGASIGIAVDRHETEEARRESERRLSTLMSNLPGMAYRCRNDADWTLEFVSEGCLQLTGYQAEELTCGRSAAYAELIRPDHRDHVRRVRQTSLRQREYFELTYPITAADGSERWVWERGRGIFSEEGSLLFLEGFVADHTDRKRAEQALRLDESRLEALLRLSQMNEAPLSDIVSYAMEEAVRLTQSRIGYVAFVSEDESVLTMYGFSRTALEECSIPGSPREFPVAESGLLGEAVRLRRPVILNDYTAPHPRKKGVPRGHVALKRQMSVPVFDEDRIVILAGVGNKGCEYDEADVRQLTLLMSGVWRIVQRKRMAESLRASEARLGVTLDAVTEGAWDWDIRSGRIQYNDRWIETLGYSREEVSSDIAFWENIIHPDDLGRVRQALKSHFDGETQVFECEDRLRTRDGKWRANLIRGKVIERDRAGRPIRMVGTDTDITGRREAEAALKRYAEELERRNTEIRQFAYVVSHDLRAPLINFKGFTAELRRCLDDLRAIVAPLSAGPEEAARTAAERILDREAVEALNFLDSSSDRMENLIDALLKLSRLGRQDLAPETIETRALVEGIVRVLARQIEERGARVKLGALPEITADRVSLEQILSNILSNAVLYLDPHRPGLIAVEAEQGDGDWVFRVRDNGQGIAEEDFDKVFAPFRRAGNSDVPGEGMGLAYVQALVRRMGGKIWFESRLGEGSEFAFTVPQVPAEGKILA